MSDTNRIAEQEMFDEAKNRFLVYPLYPVNDVINTTIKKEPYPDAYTVTKIEISTSVSEKKYENNLSEELIPEYLDLPGSALDDEQEKIGAEDEENNYYSLGGDYHNNLDEDHPE